MVFESCWMSIPLSFAWQTKVTLYYLKTKKTFLTKTRDQIAEGDFEHSKKKEKPILTCLHKKLMN